jgi:hypothetical protein
LSWRFLLSISVSGTADWQPGAGDYAKLVPIAGARKNAFLSMAWPPLVVSRGVADAATELDSRSGSLGSEWSEMLKTN